MKKIINLCNKITIWLSGITLFLMMLLTATDVFGRYLLKNPITGMNDLTELMMVAIIFLGLPETTSADGHIKVEFITARLGLGSRLIIKVATQLLSIIVAAVMAWRLTENACYVYHFPENTLVLEISKFPFISIAAVGCSLLTLVLSLATYDTIAQIRKTFWYGST